MSPLILVSNDDGVDSPGLAALSAALEPLGRVMVVAPNRNQSAAGHSLTLERPLRIEQVGPSRWAVDGTPTDAVYLALNAVLGGRRPDLVVSGINLGANLADDITYSGTVAAALEGMLLGAPAIAVSLARGPVDFHFHPAASFAAELAARVLEVGLPEHTFLNVNVPVSRPGDHFEWSVTTQGKRQPNAAIVDRTDPRGRTYYWIGGDEMSFHEIPGSDATTVLRERRISVTPLGPDLTRRDLIPLIGGWKLGT